MIAHSSLTFEKSTCIQVHEEMNVSALFHSRQKYAAQSVVLAITQTVCVPCATHI